MNSNQTASVFQKLARLVPCVLGMIALASFLPADIKAQNEPGDSVLLTAAKPVEGQLGGGEASTYKLQLDAGDYLGITVDQRGIDVVIALFDPSGRKLTEIDSPNGDFGPEVLTWIAETAGAYSMEVRSLDAAASPGAYRIVISDRRTATEADRKRFAARTAYEEGLSLETAQTPEAFRNAIAKYTESLGLFRSVGDKSEEARAHFDIGSLYHNLQEKDKAIESLNAALTIFEDLGDKDGTAQSLYGIGEVYFDFDERAKALGYYTRTLTILRELENSGAEGVVLISAGRALESTGEPDKALKNYERALSIFKSLGDVNRQAIVLNNIGVIYRTLGDNQKSLGYFEDVLKLGGPVTGTFEEAAALTNAGSAYERLGKNEEALQFHSRALTLFRKLGDPYAEAASLNNAGRVYQSIGEYRKALEFYESALPLLRSFGEKDVESGLLNNIGTIHFELGEHERSLEYLNRASLIDRAIGNKIGSALSLNNTMRVWYAKKDRSIAIFFGKQAVSLFQEIRLAISGMDKDVQQKYRGTVEKAYRLLAEILVEEGRLFEAEETLALLKDEEYAGYVKRDAEEIKKLSARTDLRPNERAALQKYEEIADKLAGYGARFTELERLRAQEGPDFKQEAEYLELKEMLDNANAAFRIFLREDLAKEIGREANRDIANERAMQSRLAKWGDGTVSLYTIAGEDRYRVILTTPRSQIDGKTEIKASELNAKVFEFRSALQNPAVDPRPLGKELYDILLKPIEKDLVASGAKTLLLSLDGTLRYIPIAALSPDGVHYLAEKYRMVLITSASRLGISEETVTDWSVLAMGVSKNSSVNEPFSGERIEFAPLPGVRRELKAIVRSNSEGEAEEGVINGKTMIDEEFSLPTFANGVGERLSGNRRFNVLHFATHFRLSSDMATSFLLLGDNQLLTLEAVSDDSRLDLAGVELVALSACNTAFGSSAQYGAGSSRSADSSPDDPDGSEVDSLATFIELRGAKSVLATLWPVVDESTALLMREFYDQKTRSAGSSKAEAMQRAQLAMIRGDLKSSGQASGCRGEIEDFGGEVAKPFKCNANQPFAHPYFWSPFVLIGNWR